MPLVCHYCSGEELEFVEAIFHDNCFQNSPHSNVRYDERYPFDWKTPIGFFIVSTWQCITLIVVVRFVACMVPMALGWLLITFSLNKDWKNDLRSLDEMVKTKQPRADIIEHITEIIRSHSNIKQLSKMI